MNLLGIEFAPINIPLKRRLQTLAVAGWLLLLCSGVIGMVFCIYLVLFTRFWWLTILYLSWAWIIDKDAAEQGGRKSEWMTSWALWKYGADYFPFTLERLPWVELDPKRNYMFCYFPHGIAALSASGVFCCPCPSTELFPKHKPHFVVLSQNFFMPIFREVALSIGFCSSSAKSISYILSKPEGGNIAVIAVGGIAEAYYSRPGQYKIVLKKRKGFVKLALENGSPLVPVLAFGGNDLYDQVTRPDGSMFKRIQEAIRKVIGWAPVIVLGRGFFQYSFGILPHRRPVTSVVGRPIEVKKVERATPEQIEELHQKFMHELVKMFEEQKFNYLKDPETKHLEIV